MVKFGRYGETNNAFDIQRCAQPIKIWLPT